MGFPTNFELRQNLILIPLWSGELYYRANLFEIASLASLSGIGHCEVLIVIRIENLNRSENKIFTKQDVRVVPQ